MRLSQFVQAKAESFGPLFDLVYPDQYAAEIPQLKETLERVEKAYKTSGVHIKKKLRVDYRNPKYKTNFYQNGTIFVGRVDYPGQTRNYVTLIHEIAHFLHEQQTSGGFNNRAIKEKWSGAKKGGDWYPPTDYVRKNPLEWFAEMMQTLVLHPEKLKPEVQQFLREVVT